MTTSKNISIFGSVRQESIQPIIEGSSFSLSTYTHPVVVSEHLKESLLADLSSKKFCKGLFKGIVTESFETINNVTKKITQFIITDYTL